jgi:pimeloyl-ACP methyl ester carboxylesterase
VHGYSMGGGIVTQLLARYPERVLSAGYGGSGIREVDEERIAVLPADREADDPLDDEARAMLRASPTRDEDALAAIRGYDWQPGERGDLDLRTVQVPVLAINGELDGFHAKTTRMKRELVDFANVMLPGRSHLSAIEPGYIPDEYIEATVKFIHDSDP